MANSKLSPFEQFLRLFSALKRATGGTPSRIDTFYLQSHKVKAAVDSLDEFLLFSGFEKEVFHGVDKQFSPVSRGFEAGWKEYKSNWEQPIFNARRVRMHPAFRYRRDEVSANRVSDLVSSWYEDESFVSPEQDTENQCCNPNPEEDYQLELDRHNPAAAVALGINYLETHDIYPDSMGATSNDPIDNLCRISTQGFSFFEESVGLNFEEIFRRWRNIPPIFYPTQVANTRSDPLDDPLFKLINDAILAYVMGATAAAIITCRTALETVLKEHYGKGQWNNDSLARVITLAEQRYKYIKGKRLQRLRKDANNIVHNYVVTKKASKEEEKIIVEFLTTVKYLVQRAPPVN